MRNFISAILDFYARPNLRVQRSGNVQIQARARWAGAELTPSKASLTDAAAATL